MAGHTITTETAQRIAEMSNQLRELRRRKRTRPRDRPKGGNRVADIIEYRNPATFTIAASANVIPIATTTEVINTNTGVYTAETDGSVTVNHSGDYIFTWSIYGTVTTSSTATRCIVALYKWDTGTLAWVVTSPFIPYKILYFEGVSPNEEDGGATQGTVTGVAAGDIFALGIGSQIGSSDTVKILFVRFNIERIR